MQNTTSVPWKLATVRSTRTDGVGQKILNRQKVRRGSMILLAVSELSIKKGRAETGWLDGLLRSLDGIFAREFGVNETFPNVLFSSSLLYLGTLRKVFFSHS